MKTLFLMMIISVASFSCSKKDDAPANNPTATGFTWYENGGTTAQTATTATFSTQYKTLMATGSSGMVFEINLTGTTPGTYPVGASNVITYTKTNPYFIPSSGNVIITSNANGKMSGTFQGSGTATAGITSVSGTFTNITVVP